MAVSKWYTHALYYILSRELSFVMFENRWIFILNNRSRLSHKTMYSSFTYVHSEFNSGSFTTYFFTFHYIIMICLNRSSTPFKLFSLLSPTSHLCVLLRQCAGSSRHVHAILVTLALNTKLSPTFITAQNI